MGATPSRFVSCGRGDGWGLLLAGVGKGDGGHPFRAAGRVVTPVDVQVPEVEGRLLGHGNLGAGAA